MERRLFFIITQPFAGGDKGEVGTPPACFCPGFSPSPKSLIALVAAGGGQTSLVKGEGVYEVNIRYLESVFLSVREKIIGYVLHQA
jgi:hypothetical protein